MKNGKYQIRSIKWPLLILGVGFFLSIGCQSTYQKDCHLILNSDPPKAEVWKKGFFIGYTPQALRYTTTWEDKERGYIRIPPLLIKKEGFEPYRLDLEIDLNDGYYWEGVVSLTHETGGEQEK